MNDSTSRVQPSPRTGDDRPTEPLVGAVILTHNQKDLTLGCISSLRAADYETLRIVLVDNASVDGTIDAVAELFPEVEIVRSNENLGVAGGRNLGIRYLLNRPDCAFVLIIDNDTEVAPTFLRPLVDALVGEPSVGVVSPKVYRMDDRKVFDEAGGCRVNLVTGSTKRRGAGELDRGQYDDPASAHGLVPGGVCTLSRREVIETTGGLDEIFNPYGFEDLDYILRVREAGWTTRFVPSSVIYHKGSKTGFGGYSAEYAGIKGRNLRRFLRRHSSPWQRVAFNLLLPVLGLRTILREVLRGNWRAPFKLMASFLRS